MQGTSSTAIAPRGKRNVRPRSRKVCHYCHARKTRCNVSIVGTPCSTCAWAQEVCTIRRRKNQRQVSPPTSRREVGSEDNASRVAKWQEHAQVLEDTETLLKATTQDLQPEHTMDTPSSAFMTDPSVELDAAFDLSHLNDLEDIFTFTNEFPTASSRQQTNGPHFSGLDSDTASGAYNPAPLVPTDGVGILQADEDFLRSRGCFELPPANVLREMMKQYFRRVHPNLPIIVEDTFWARWNGETIDLTYFSPFVLRAMLFAASCYVDSSTLLSLGLNGQREARNFYYRQAKLMFDFGLESDPIASAQGCLLLTYMSPNFSRLQDNASWLNHAHRLAKIAGADTFHRLMDEDRPTAVLLKRIWWAVLFRDRLLSLGIRRSLQVHLRQDSIWYDDKYALKVSDFESELGQSPVHDIATQMKNIEVLNALCRLVSRLSNPLMTLYEFDLLEDRLHAASTDLAATIAALKEHLMSLRRWHSDIIERFPFPVSLDDVHDTLCLYVNMLFIYHDSMTFALHMHLVLIHESFPASHALFEIEESRRELHSTNQDLARRLQELVQMRVMKDLPITATPLIAPSLILQAINVAASRGSGAESIEVRQLDIFTQTLKSQQTRYDGSEFTIDVLNNVISYAQDNEHLTANIGTWRENSNDGDVGTGRGVEDARRPAIRKKLDWCSMLRERPKLLIRLMFHLDFALRIWGVPQEKHFPRSLRRVTA